MCVIKSKTRVTFHEHNTTHELRSHRHELFYYARRTLFTFVSRSSTIVGGKIASNSESRIADSINVDESSERFLRGGP